MTAPDNVSPIAAARRYAALGMAVVPLHSPTEGGCSCGDAHENSENSIGKHPRTKNGLKNATTDAAIIAGWWRSWPSANIGLVTGAQSGIWALDIDTLKGGELTLNELEAANGRLPETVEAKTGSGGRHLLFVHPGYPVPNSTRRLGPGLDVRGDGGYVVAAPSLNSRGAYRWTHEPGSIPLAEAPAWLLELVCSKLPPPDEREPSWREVRPAAKPDKAHARAAAYLARMEPSISGSGGHDALWAAAQAMVRGFRLSEGEALELLAGDFNHRCQPEWSEKELIHKVASAAGKSSLPWGYLLDAERTSDRTRSAATGSQEARTSDPSQGSAATREPGSDDGEETQEVPVPKPSLLKLQPISVLLAEQIPPTEWLIAPWIETGSIGAIVAPPNIGKTLLAFHFSVQVAAAGKRVAIIEEEGGKRGFQSRISRAVAAAGGPGACKTIDWSFKPRISLMSGSHVADLCDELAGYDLVIIDSLARVTTGMEENDAKEVGQLVASLDIIREATKAAVYSIHHTGKSKWKPGEVPTLADGRGSSALAGGLDTVIALAYVAEEEQLTGVVSFTIHITKQRDEDNKVAPRLARIKMTGPEAYVEMEESPTTRGPSPAEQRVAALLQVVLFAIPEAPGEPITREALQDKLGKRPSDIRSAVNRLIEQGKIKELVRRRLTRVPFTAGRGGERSE
jgi:hypothetical protein